MTSIKAVAEKAKVSISTVSRVLNQKDIVREETRDKVYSAMKEVQYFPTKSSTKKSNIIGLVIPDIKIDFAGKVIAFIEENLEDTPYDLLLLNLKRKRTISKSFRENIAFKKVDALIIISATMDDESVEFFRSVDIPVVFMQSKCKREKSICTNNYDGAIKAVQFFLEKKHENIAFIGWKPDDNRVDDRFQGYRYAIKKNGVTFRPEMASFGSLSIEGGYKATEKLVKKFTPDAIFYACDTMAFGGYKYFKAKDVQVPQDISIIGFDDLEIASVIGLTTMKQFINTKTRIAVSYLLGRLSGEIQAPLEEELSVSPKLIVRDSTR